MKYKLKIDETVLPIEVEAKENNRFTAQINDESYTVEHTPVSENQIHLNINGRGVNVFVADEGEGKTVVIDGASYCVQDADLLERGGFKRKGLADAPQEVTPPMPSVVVRVLVNVGDDVAKGDAVIVVSAMKMETTLNAPHAGKISAVHFSEGEKVMPGQILIDIESDSDRKKG